MDDKKLEYLAGFFDAEGNVCVKPPKGRAKHQAKVTIASTDRRPLELFQNLWGGSIYTFKRKSDRHRVCYAWEKYLSKTTTLAAELAQRTVIKSGALSLAAEFCTTLKHGRRLSEADVTKREEIRLDVLRLNAQGGNTEAHEVRRKEAYWAGLFDGDGSVTVRKQSKASGGRAYYLAVQIHSVTKPVLDGLKDEFGGSVHGPYGNRRTMLWSASASKAEGFLRHIMPHCLIKRERIEEALKIRKLNATPRTFKKRGSNNGLILKDDSVILAMQEIKKNLLDMNRLGA